MKRCEYGKTTKSLFGAELIDALTLKGWTQRELAAKLDVSRGYIHQILYPDTPPTKILTIAISHVMGLNADHMWYLVQVGRKQEGR